MGKRRGHVHIKKNTGLSLVALMDIFTVLVFFLIFNVHDEQILISKKIKNIPETLVTIAELKKDKSYDVLEVLSSKEIYFNGNKMTRNLVVNKLSKFCSQEKNGCEKLAIIAPEDLNYSVVDDFVKIADVAGFIHVNLILRHNT